MEILEENKNCPFRNSCNHVDCDTFCMKRFKTEYYFNNAFISQEHREKVALYLDSDQADLAAFQRLAEIEKTIKNFVDDGKNIFIYSQQTGNGKSSWSYRLCRAYINKVWFNRPLRPIVLFISVPRFLLELKANIEKKSEYIQHILSSCSDADLVVWDDIGSKNGTEFEISYLLNIIDQRISAGKSNVYSSNLSTQELHQALGDRLYSRIVNYSENIEFKGKDKRGLAK